MDVWFSKKKEKTDRIKVLYSFNTSKFCLHLISSYRHSFLYRGTYANSADPDQNVASDKGLHFLLY